MAEGRSNKAIADRFDLTAKTIEALISSILTKLDLPRTRRPQGFESVNRARPDELELRVGLSVGDARAMRCTASPTLATCKGSTQRIVPGVEHPGQHLAPPTHRCPVPGSRRQR